MANQTRPLNLTDFTGGLNLRANEFNLADNESPDMLNVEVDPRGGISTRKGWERWNETDVTADPWNPRHGYIHELADGTDWLFITNNGKVLASSDGSFAAVQTAGPVDLTVSASPHLADFASWGDHLYVVCGHTQSSARLATMGGQALLLTPTETGGASWNDDYLSPGSNRFPRADFVAAHAGRMWVASTQEDGTFHPNRVRWSHPNVPDSWASQDYVDLLEGGGPITAIVPHEDHLLVFKQSSVWAIYGYDTESQQVVNVSRKVGAFNRQVVTRSPTGVYFVSWPEGVFRIERGRLEEISVPLRPAFTSDDWNQSATGNMWLGWLGNRLWFSAPYWENGVADDARSIFVWDESVGSWTMFRSSQNEGLGPFMQGGYGQGSYDLFGVCRCGPVLVQVDERDDAADTIPGTPAPFQTRYTTKWLHAGWPDRKKRWRRPTFIMSKEPQPYTLKCSVFIDFDEQTPKRTFDVAVTAPEDVLLYDDGHLYDSGLLYGAPTEGSELRRATGFGSARSVQLQLDGEPGKAWRIDAIIAKYRLRRFT